MKSKKKSMGSTAATWIVLLLILITELFCYTWCRVQCIETGYEIEKEKKRYEELKRLQKSLRIELVGLKAPERISGIASREIGLIMPDYRHTVVIP
jgi:cell division protein FtsL